MQSTTTPLAFRATLGADGSTRLKVVVWRGGPPAPGINHRAPPSTPVLCARYLLALGVAAVRCRADWDVFLNGAPALLRVLTEIRNV